ncbi:MAG TPA: ABC transporter substrate-binding protein [Xanthobacteraceae bacterium]|nr:ABC transporter substrate-binding protein [Xanthobacteraceae bacterium]
MALTQPRFFNRHALVAGLAAALLLGLSGSASLAQEPIKVGLVAALSGGSAKSGEGITRGLTIAIDEINAAGGLLGGRKLELVRRDDESNPSKGQIAARELIDQEKVAVMFGGIDSPVALAIVPIANNEKVPFFSVWAAATPITRNGANPNYIFRVSAVDVLVDKALVQYARKTFDAKSLGLALVNNPWGESNDKGLHVAAEEQGVKIAGVEKFEDRDVDMVPQLTRLRAAGADVLILVGNAAPGAQVMKSLQRINWNVPIVSHWGISGGRFPELAGPWSQKVAFVQTFSFFGKLNPVGEKVLSELKAKYPDIKGPGDVLPPVGVANAYDAMHLVAMAIKSAGSTDGDKMRQALESTDRYEGLIKTYVKPFSPANHDALNENDYIMVRYNGDDIVPVATQ